MKIKPQKNILITATIATLILLVIGVIHASNTTTNTGKREAEWVFNLFGGKYYNRISNNLSENELIYLLSLQNDAENESHLSRAILRKKCSENTVDCTTLHYAAANLLIANENFSAALALTNSVKSKPTDSECPIQSESTKLNILAKLISKDNDTENRAISAINQIKSLAGGVSQRLDSKTCLALATSKPELFHEHAILLANLMILAGGNETIAGIYIQSLNKLTY